MGACGENKENRKRKYSVKLKLSTRNKKYKKNKGKNEVKDINFEIIDTITENKKQILVRNNLTLSELLILADYNICGDLDIQFNDNRKLNDELNTNLKDILEEYFKEQDLLTVTILVTTKGLSIPSNIKKAYQDMSLIIGNACFDDPRGFEITIYDSKRDTLETYFFKKDIYKEIQKFNSFSSFCSAKGILYISGGENDHPTDIKQSVEEYNDFVSIDMNKLNYYNLYLEVLPHLCEKRTWHSMIFVPNQYIFIVGGLNTKTVEIYDIDKNEIYLDSELKEKRCEPTMCLVNNIYLYAFCGFSPFSDFNDSIERCNLLKKKREWESIEYSNRINPSFFGISYYKEEEILLVSSKDNIEDDNKSYTVKIEKEEDTPNEVNEIILQCNEIRAFKDKLFYPIYDNFAINSPLIVGEDKKMLLLDMNTGNIQAKNYI